MGHSLETTIVEPLRREASDCELCAEVETHGRAVTGYGGGTRGADGFSRLVDRVEGIDVISGLGGIRSGYVLLVPHRHVLSVGELQTEHRTRFFRECWQVADLVRHEFNCDVVLVEHGSSGSRGARGGACIRHSHAHLFPVPRGANTREFVPRGCMYVRGADALGHAAAASRNYYYCASRPGHGELLLDPDLPSQFARRVWARLLGAEEAWDWAAAPYLDNAEFTARTLRTARPQHEWSPSGALAETLRTYGQAAKTYAARTRHTNSANLRSDLDGFAERGRGPILDAGCGAGRDAYYLAERTGRRVLALDATLALLREVPDHKSVCRVAGDVRSLPIDDRSVGSVWCSAVLLHLPADDVSIALREFLRVLTPGGLAHISVKIGKGLSRERLFDNPLWMRSVHYYDDHQLVGMVRRAGFASVEWRISNDNDAGGRSQSWLKVDMWKPE